MKKNYYLIILIVCFSSLKSQNLIENFKNYSEIEIETEKCLDAFIKSKNVNWSDIKPIFENYFSNAKITQQTESLSIQYYDILGYFENPNGKFPIFGQKKLIIDVREKMNLDKQSVLQKKQLDCLIDKYIDEQSNLNEESAYYVFGTSLELCREMPGISPGLIAGGIRTSINQKDLEKSLYQKTIVLMFIFDMTYFLSDSK